MAAYQGPVPNGYNESYFRQTGKTVPLKSGSSNPAATNFNSTQAASSDPYAGQQDLYNQINDIYSPQYDYLNQAESAVRADYPTIQQEITGQYDVNKQLAGDTKTSGLNSLGQQETAGTRRSEDAASAARRTYNEMQQGARQRFGGASSAAGAAYEIGGREFQKQSGSIKQGFNDFMQTIEQKRGEVEQTYNTGLQQLELTKNTAMNSAYRDFQNKLLEITNNRTQLESAKAQARLSVLQDLRNKVYQIDLQNKQFQQTLELQKAQNAQYVNSLATSTGAAVQGGQTAVNTYGTNTSDMGQGFSYINPEQVQNGNVLSGDTGTKKNDWWNPFD